MLLYNKQKKNHNAKGNRILISVTVLGSAGPIRFVAYEEDLIASVIDTALKCYAREGRLPLLGSDFNDFLLYCPMAGPEALNTWNPIGSLGARNFTLCRKPEVKKVDDGRSNSTINGAKKGGKKEEELCDVEETKESTQKIPYQLVHSGLLVFVIDSLAVLRFSSSYNEKTTHCF